MKNVLLDIPFVGFQSWVEIDDERLLIVSKKSMKVFSLRTYEEVIDLTTDVSNFQTAVTSDKKLLFIATKKGIVQYSLPDLIIINEFKVSLKFSHLTILNSKNYLIFNKTNTLHFLTLKYMTPTSTKREHKYKTSITSIKSILDESCFFTTGTDKTLKRWTTSTLSVKCSVKIGSPGTCLSINEDSKSVFVGMINGSVFEYTTNYLFCLRKIEFVQNGSVKSIIRLMSGDDVACFEDGNIRFLSKDINPIKVCDQKLYFITLLSNETLAINCYNGFKILRIFTDEFNTQNHDLFSQILKSNPKSSSFEKVTKFPNFNHKIASSIFSSLVVSVVVGLGGVQRSHMCSRYCMGRRRVVTGRYVFETVGGVSDGVSSLCLFDRGVKVVGRCLSESNPLSHFRVTEIKRGKWIFTLSQDTSIEHLRSFTRATSFFKNGYLKCYTVEGQLTTKSEDFAILKVKNLFRRILSIASNGLVVTLNQELYLLNPLHNTITELSQQ